MKVAIYGRILQEQDVPYVRELIASLSSYEVEIKFHEVFFKFIKQSIELPSKFELFFNSKDIGEVDFIISVGGDGTLLDVVTIVGGSGIPVIGINTGRLGFLSSINKSQIPEVVKAIVSGKYSIEERSLLSLESNISLFGSSNYALNEFALHKKDVSSLIVVHTYINGQFLNSFWADGLIVSTPTGSTAYNLSCGGPIVFPNSNNFVINPVAPHNLTQRPIVVSDDCIISFEIEGRSNQFLCTLDSRIETVDSNIQMAVKKADFTIKILRIETDDFMTTLRNKMMWGIDKRN